MKSKTKWRKSGSHLSNQLKLPEGNKYTKFMLELSRTRKNNEFPYKYISTNMAALDGILTHFGCDTISELFSDGHLTLEMFDEDEILVEMLHTRIGQTLNRGFSNEEYAQELFEEKGFKCCPVKFGSYEDMALGIDMTVTSAKSGKSYAVQVKPYSMYGQGFHRNYDHVDVIIYVDAKKKKHKMEMENL